MAELISLWNSSDMGCNVGAMLLVDVVHCWGFMAFVWLCFCCNV